MNLNRFCFKIIYHIVKLILNTMIMMNDTYIILHKNLIYKDLYFNSIIYAFAKIQNDFRNKIFKQTDENVYVSTEHNIKFEIIEIFNYKNN